MQRSEKIRKLFLRPVEHILRKQSAPRAQLQNFHLLGFAQRAPHLFKLPRQHASEHRMHIARGVEVPGLAEFFRVARIIAEFGIVQA